MAIETGVQWMVHAFEQGSLAVWVRRAMIVAVLCSVSGFWMTNKFTGFNTPEAMDQAQIARQIAKGRGYSTLYVRPLALRLMLRDGGSEAPGPLPDVSQPPLGPLTSAVLLRLGGKYLETKAGRPVSPAEQVIALTGILFFAAALGVYVLLGKMLFGPRTAYLSAGLVAATAIMWRFATSGLPQMAMMFFFNASLLALAGALSEKEQGRTARSVVLATIGAFLLGLATLGSGVAGWTFAGFWIFAVVLLRPRARIAAATIAAYVLPLLPWAWHNWKALGQPIGLPLYELCRQAGESHLALMADFEPVLRFRLADFLQNTSTQMLEQVAGLFGFFGQNIVAVAFFFAMFLHPFGRWIPAQMRWGVLLMWLGAFAGMSVAGVGGVVSANQLHVLFLPVMILYGLDFLLLLWRRIGLDQPLMRTAFLVILYALTALPLLQSMTTKSARMNWPPYLPPLIQQFGKWIGPGEAIASDIPWATAWYAERVSLLVPESVAQFELIHHQRLLHAPLVALYFTPMSGGSRTYGDIVTGRYSDWARFITRDITAPELQNWILTTAVNLPVDGQSVLFADRVRWK